jgi:hypothetical protein
MSKYNLDKVVEKNQKLYNKDPDKANKIGLGSSLKSLETAPCVVMPEWWQKATNTKGLPFGQIVQIAGDSDSGKTSMAIETMKAAISQGIAVLYVETENKTTKEDLEAWGVDTSQVMLVKSAVAEEAATLMFGLWDEFYKSYPEGKLVGIVDSWGNPPQGARRIAIFVNAGRSAAVPPPLLLLRRFQRGGHARPSLQPRGYGQALRPKKHRIEKLGRVTRTIVGQDRDYGVAGAKRTRHADGPRYIDPSRAADAKPFVLQKVEHHRDRLGIRDLAGKIDRQSLKVARHPTLADPLRNRGPLRRQSSRSVKAIERRPHRIGDADLDVRLGRAQPGGGAG